MGQELRAEGTSSSTTLPPYFSQASHLWLFEKQSQEPLYGAS